MNSTDRAQEKAQTQRKGKEFQSKMHDHALHHIYKLR